MANSKEEINTSMEECDICHDVVPNLRELSLHMHTKHVGIDCTISSCWSCRIKHRRENSKDAKLNREVNWFLLDEDTRYKEFLNAIDEEDTVKPKNYINTPIPRRWRPVNIPLKTNTDLQDPRLYSKIVQRSDNKCKLHWITIDQIGETDYIYKLLPPKEVQVEMQTNIIATTEDAR